MRDPYEPLTAAQIGKAVAGGLAGALALYGFLWLMLSAGTWQ